MKKLWLSLLLGVLAFASHVSAQNNVYNWTADGSEKLKSTITDIQLGDLVWGVDWKCLKYRSVEYIDVDKNKYLQFGSKNNPLIDLTFTSKSFAGRTIISISICADRPEEATTTFVAKINDTPVGNAKTLGGSITDGFTDCSFENINKEVPDDGKLELVFVNTNYDGKTDGGLNIKSITIEYAGDVIVPEKRLEDAILKFAVDSHSIKAGDEPSASPKLTNNGTDGKITYASSNTKVATVDPDNGWVTGVAAGEATITATSAQTENYKEGKASYILTVTEPNPVPVDPNGTPAVFNFADPWTLALENGNHLDITEGKTESVNGYTFSEGPVSLVGLIDKDEAGATKSGNVRLYCTTSDSDSDSYLWSYRMSINTYMTISCSENHNLVSVVFKFHPSDENFIANLDEAAFSTGKYDNVTHTLNLTPNNKSVTITPKKAIRISSITAYYTSSSTGICDIVTYNSDAPVEYYNLQGVRVTSPTPGLYIRVQGKQATKIYLK